MEGCPFFCVKRNVTDRVGGVVVVVPCLLIRGDELWEKLGAPPPSSNDIVLVQSSTSTQIHIEG